MPLLPGMGAYIASKAALTKLVEYLAAENEGKVRVLGVHPGLIRTEGNDTEEHGLVFPYDDGLCDFPPTTPLCLRCFFLLCF